MISMLSVELERRIAPEHLHPLFGLDLRWQLAEYGLGRLTSKST